MFMITGLLNRSSLSFIFVTFVRALSIVACILGLAAEIFTLVEGFKGVSAANDAASAPAPKPTSTGNTTNDVIHAVTYDVMQLAAAAPTSTNTCGYIGYSDVPKSFGGIVFFAVAQLFGILMVALCLVSEIAPPKSPAFFDYIFPPLGQQFGVGFVGTLEIFIACTILSRNASIFPTVAAWFLLVLGILNFFLGIIFGARIRQKRSIFEAGKTYAKNVTHYDDIEKGVRVGKKGFELGKKAFEAGKSKGATLNGKKVNISGPTQGGPVASVPPPTYDGQPVRVFNGAHEVPQPVQPNEAGFAV